MAGRGTTPTYEGVQRIGSSGFAETFRAWAPTLGRSVVVKVYSASASSTAGALVEDLDALGAVSDPGLVPILEGGRTHDGRPFVVRRRVPGRPLDAREGVSLDELLVAGCVVAVALAALHGRGLAHGAVSPDNVLVDRAPDGTAVRLTDPLPPSVVAARPGGFRHDPAFVAPEVVVSGRPDAAGDVYSLAATISAALGHQATPLAVHELLDRCLSPRPEDRPTAGEVAERLRAALHRPTAGDGRRTPPVDDPPRAEPSSVEPAGPPTARRWAAAGAVLGATLVAVGAMVAPEVMASRPAPTSTRDGVDVVLARRTTTTSPRPPVDGIEVTAAALVAGPHDQAQLKVAVRRDPTAPVASTEMSTSVVALVGRTGRFTPPAGEPMSPRTLPTTPAQLGVAAVEEVASVTAIPANPPGISEEYLGGDGRARATFASRPDVPVFYVPDGSELLGLALLDDAGRIVAFSSAAAWPELRSANGF